MPVRVFVACLGTAIPTVGGINDLLCLNYLKTSFAAVVALAIGEKYLGGGHVSDCVILGREWLSG